MKQEEPPEIDPTYINVSGFFIYFVTADSQAVNINCMVLCRLKCSLYLSLIIEFIKIVIEIQS